MASMRSSVIVTRTVASNNKVVHTVVVADVEEMGADEVASEAVAMAEAVDVVDRTEVAVVQKLKPNRT